MAPVGGEDTGQVTRQVLVLDALRLALNGARQTLEAPLQAGAPFLSAPDAARVDGVAVQQSELATQQLTASWPNPRTVAHG